jgi:predicted phage terminase large subunit-like protein
MRVVTEAWQAWQEMCREIQEQTPVNEHEELAEKQSRIRRAIKDYAFFFEYYFPHYAKCKCARFHIGAANEVRANANLKAVYKWARGHAKSTHMDVGIPLWLKIQPERAMNVMVLVGKSQANANKLLSDVQAELESNRRYINDFGLQKSMGSWEEGNFATRDGCAFYALGRGQSPRGLRFKELRPDYIVIDDVDDDELCRNEERVDELVDWLKEALFGALDGGRGRFIMVGNLISKNSALARIAAQQVVRVSQVNIIDRNGNVTWKEKWSRKEVQDLEDFMGYRSFQKEFMNNPVTEGAVFRHDWIRWKKALPLHRYDHLIAYCDPSFKSSSKNDYKAIKVWGKAGTELHNLKNFVRQCSVAEMVRWFFDLHESIPENAICDYYIEANFLQDIILDEFDNEGRMRGYQLPIRPDHRKKPDKFQRIEAISPLWERGFTYYNEALQNDRDTLTSLDQLLAFQKGSRTHDDAPDADEGAIYLLQQRTRSEHFQPRIKRRSSPKTMW